MALLSGMAIALGWNADWDHTYVESDTGRRWGCFGRDQGGNALDVGLGQDVVADCLAEPNGTAGIRYAITGVCQQAANRILYSTGVSVANAGGYGLSLMTYGAYGRGHWLRRDICLASIESGESHLHLSAIGNHNEEPLAVADANVDTVAFASFAKAALPELSDVKLQELLEIQRRLQGSQSELVCELDAGHISDQVFLDRTKLLLRVSMDRCQELLGRDQAAHLFGPAACTPENLIEDDKFRRDRASHVSRTIGQ